MKSVIPTPAVFFFLLSFLVRILFIFITSDSGHFGQGTYEDAYNHWRIAFLSKETSFYEGFLKLTDINGMQYFWSFTHPLFTIFAFTLTGSDNFEVQRGMTAFFGALGTTIIFLLSKRFWAPKVAFISALFISLSPFFIFNDSAGMAEPIGVFFLLTAVLLWPKRTLLTGMCLALALMSRAENWPLTLLLIISMIVLSPKVVTKDKLLLFVGFAIPVTLYFYYLFINTGNPIYPLSQNLKIVLLGNWNKPITAYYPPIVFRYSFVGVMVLSLMASLLVVVKKPKARFFYLVGFMNLIMLGITWGVSKYFQIFNPSMLYKRHMLLAYEFLVVLIIVFFLKGDTLFKRLIIFLPKKMKWILVIATFMISQFLWIPIIKSYTVTKNLMNQNISNAKKIGPYYTNGKIVVMNSIYPSYFYALVKYGNIPGTDIVNDLSDPYYLMDQDPLTNWSEYKRLAVEWIKENNVKLIVTYNIPGDHYIKLAMDLPQHFTRPVFLSPDSKLVILKTD